MELRQSIEILAIPILMILDYYLTIFGNKLRLEGYSSHFEIDSYELNPLWVTDIAKHKLLNFKHLSLVFLATLFLYCLNRIEIDSAFYKFLYGALLVNFVLVNSRHISNILLFRYIKNDQGLIKGQVKLSEKYVYVQSAIQYSGCATIIVPLALLSRSLYVYGALSGCLILAAAHMAWYRKKKREKIRLYPNVKGSHQ
jgi:hypothetical protein